MSAESNLANRLEVWQLGNKPKRDWLKVAAYGVMLLIGLRAVVCVCHLVETYNDHQLRSEKTELMRQNDLLYREVLKYKAKMGVLDGTD